MKKYKISINDNLGVKNLNMLNFFVLFLLCIILSSITTEITSAVRDYQQQGYLDKTYYDGARTLFNTDFVSLYGSPTISSKTISTNSQGTAPLFYDINDDGLNEIFISQDNLIVMYQNRTLDFIDSYPMNDTVYSFTLITYSGDTYLLSLTDRGATGDRLYEYVWNGSTFNYVSYHDGGYNSPYNCDTNTGRCIIIGKERNSVDRSFILGNGSPFLDTATPHSDIGCMAKDPQVIFNDIDNDGQKEFIYTSKQESTPYSLFINVGHINSSGDIVYESSDSVASNSISGASGCDDYRNYFTSPLIYNVVENQNEDNIVVAYSDTEDTFKMYTYKYVGGEAVEHSEHPSFYRADGKIISNPFLCKIFTDYSGINDFCVLGYTDNNATDLLAGSRKTGETVKAREFKTQNFTNYFVPEGENVRHIVHSIQADNNVEDGIDYTEVLTPFGIYQPYYPGCDILNFITGNPCELRRIYDLSYTDGIASIGYADKENIPYVDLVYTTSDNIFYIDDNFVDENAMIDEYSINPCIESVWKQNTSVQITITPVDRENDPVKAQAILYHDESFNQTAELTSAFPSGTTISFSFKANTTITNGKILLRAQDNNTENNESFDEILLNFAVGTDGVEFGECVTTVTGLAEKAEAEAEASAGAEFTNTDNRIRNAIDEYAQLAGIPLSIFFLLGLFLLDIILIGYGSQAFGKDHAFILFLILILIDFIGSILAALMGMIGIGLLVTLLILYIISGAFFIVYMIRKGSVGSGGV